MGVATSTAMLLVGWTFAGLAEERVVDVRDDVSLRR
jgi:hypothetical protein